jgi:hypothetical protein
MLFSQTIQMHNRNPLAKLIRFVQIALAFVLGFGVIQVFGQPHHSVSPRPSAEVSSYNLPIFLDFDKDNKLDRAELSSNGSLKRVSVTFGKSSWLSLPFDSGASDRGRLISSDIDNDGTADLIWISQSYPQKIVTWLGDGRGNFSQVTTTDSALSRVQEQLGNSDSGVADQSSSGTFVCVLPTANPAVLPNVTYRPCTAAAQQLLSFAQGLSPRAPLLSVLRKRGPPSQHS